MSSGAVDTNVSTGAITTWQEVNGIQSKLSRYNNTIVGLRNIVTWWNGLGEIEQAGVENISYLICESEVLINGERNAWLAIVSAQSEMESGAPATSEGSATTASTSGSK